MPAAVNAAWHARASLCFSTITATSPAATGSAVEGGAAGEQRGDVGGQVLADVVAQVVDAQILNAPAAERLPLHHSQSEGIVAWRARQSMARVRGLHLVDDDLVVAELGAEEHRLQSLDEHAVAAPVGAERQLGARGVGGPQIGDDVAAAKRVDRLLRIADEDDGRPAAERAVDHLPLHGIGVLELVDHDDGPPLVHAKPGGRLLVVEGGSQAGQQVVVAQDAELALAHLQFRENVFREVDADRGV